MDNVLKNNLRLLLFLKKWKLHVSSVVFVLACNLGNSQIIDFDEVYKNNGDIFSKIERAIDNAPSGATLLFKSAMYTISSEKALKINKSITFEGRNPGNDFKKNARGASGIKTVINTKSNITIQADNVMFKNIEFTRENLGQSVYDVLIDARHPSYLVDKPYNETQIQYKGINFNNVRLNGTAYPFHAGNGIEAKLTNVSIINYRRIGFWTDRKGRVDKSKKITFDKCVFRPENNITFDDRAISLDAGNTEYPVVWDLEETTVKNCLFNDAGIAVSRCKNMLITGSTFNDTKGKVDMAHIEEFSSDITISNNIFNCNTARTKVFVFDRELQIVNDITITNNTITGTYAFFISGYAPKNVSIKNNNFERSNSGNQHSIDFTFYENRGIEPIPFEILSEKIEISNNKGLNEAKNGSLKIDLLSTDTASNIKDYPASRRDIRRLDEGTQQIANGIYEIINKQTNKKLCPGNGDTLITKNGTGDNFRWKITSNTPYTYTIQNVGNSAYLETAVPYTEFNIFNKTPENLAPYLIKYDSAEQNLPYWTFFKKGSDFNIFAGGNERQSALGTNKDEVKLLFGKVGNPDGTRGVKPLGDNGQWIIKKVEKDGASNPSVVDRERFIKFENESMFIPKGNTVPEFEFNQNFSFNIRYATGIKGGIEEDLTYVAMQVRQIDEADQIIATSAFEIVVPGVASNKNTLSVDYTIPRNFTTGADNSIVFTDRIPTAAELPTGHKLLLLIFMLVDESPTGFANANTNIILKEEGATLSNLEVGSNTTAINVYPNPTQDLLHIEGEFERWEIYNLSGTLINEGNTSDLNVAKLPVGLYYISLIRNGKKQIFKFIKE
ncbi:T9SS type A sorting domain-containing protein [Aquimarina agarilytica]|uniref:T9SS type A sorting domain-containing protein n=1 Tax=Aquimarina agarilytica TaxID=1087449 RepID=UPI000288B8D0|nr:T9SS type A sorting domain-containing protein [Aquimarina agarilytica]